MKVIFSVLFLFFFSLYHINAQSVDSIGVPDTITYQIITKDGNKYVGKINGRKDGMIEFQSKTVGKIWLYESEIDAISSYFSKTKDWRVHFQSSNYFTTPSAYGYKKGEGSYQNIWIFFNSLTYGVSDRLSMGAGTIPVFLFGVSEFPFWITSKFSYPIIENKVNVGAGGLFLSAGDESSGLLYGIASFGSRDLHISFGYLKTFTGFTDLSYVLINASVRISPKFYLISENFIQHERSFSLIGARAMLNRSSIEFGIARLNSFDFIGIPVLGITIPLHKEGY